MQVRVNSAELGRAVRIVSGLTDKMHRVNANIEIASGKNGVSVRATNGSMFADLRIPMIGLDDESFCVDGDTFSKVVRGEKGEIEIVTDGRVLTVRAAGRTRIPMLTTSLPEMPDVKGKQITIKAEDLRRAYAGVAHAISSEPTRPTLTGALMVSDGYRLKMVALDGFRLSIEAVPVSGDELRILVPGSALKAVVDSLDGESAVTVVSDGTRVRFHMDPGDISCVLLQGDFPDYEKLIPTGGAYSAKIPVDPMVTALRRSGVVESKNNLVKLRFADDAVQVSSNSEAADFDADIPCETQGGNLNIAFNSKYLQELMGSFNSEYVVMTMNSPSSAAVVRDAENDESLRMILPVRVMG